MRIAYDHQAFSRQSVGGVSRYFCNLAQELAKFPDCKVRIFAPFHNNEFLVTLEPDLVCGSKIDFRPPGIAPVLRIVNRVMEKPRIRSWKPDLVHETYFSRHAARLKGSPVVVTVFDMIHERYPRSFWPWDTTSQRKHAAVRRADKIICISESTRAELLNLFDVPEHRVVAVPLGYTKLVQASEDASMAPRSGTTPYLLYVGNRNGYKNFSGFLDAYVSSPQLLSSLDIVCFGGGVFSRSERAHITHLGLEGKVTQRGGSDSILASIYSGARALVYPSFCEGFGLPLLEAMAYDCPVICSNSSVMPETVADAGEFFDPSDAEAMAGAIERVVFDELRRSVLIGLGRARLNKFSWRNCATETMHVYSTLC